MTDGFLDGLACQFLLTGLRPWPKSQKKSCYCVTWAAHPLRIAMKVQCRFSVVCFKTFLINQFQMPKLSSEFIWYWLGLKTALIWQLQSELLLIFIFNKPQIKRCQTSCSIYGMFDLYCRVLYRETQTNYVIGKSRVILNLILFC